MEALVRQRKRKADPCPPLHMGQWLQNKRICLRGLFGTYKRESIVDRLRQAGAKVYIYPPTQKCDILVVGEGEQQQQQVHPPYIRESQLTHPMTWCLRFDVIQPWYQYFAPKTTQELLGRSREVSALRVWLSQWQQSKGKPALCVSGPVGCGKKTLVQCVLREQGYQQIKDVCAIAECSSLLSICVELQGCTHDALGIMNMEKQRLALLCYNMEHISLLKKADKEWVERKKKMDKNRINRNSLSSSPPQRNLSQQLITRLTALIKKRMIPIIFLVQEDRKEKRSNLFWTKIVTPLCEQQRISTLHSTNSKQMLRKLSGLMGRNFAENSLNSVLAQSSGDLRAALIQLEWMIRFESVVQEKDKQHLSADPTILTRLITSSTTPFSTKLYAMELQGVSTGLSILYHLHNAIEYCRYEKKESTGADYCKDLTEALSDSDLFYPDSGYELLLPTLRASAQLTTSISSTKTFMRLRDVKEGAKLIVRESSLRLQSPTLRCASARTYNLELLSFARYEANHSGLLTQSHFAPLEKALVLSRFTFPKLPSEEKEP